MVFSLLSHKGHSFKTTLSLPIALVPTNSTTIKVDFDESQFICLHVLVYWRNIMKCNLSRILQDEKIVCG